MDSANEARRRCGLLDAERLPGRVGLLAQPVVELQGDLIAAGQKVLVEVEVEHRGEPAAAAKDGSGIVNDGDILTACQQACPTEAIVFGDLKDSTSQVAKLSHDKRGYKVFESINTKPAITYLKKVKWDNA